MRNAALLKSKKEAKIMKKTIILITVFVLAAAFSGNSCRVHPPTPPETPTIGPQTLIFDDFLDGDNRTDTANFGGYWYTFDDLSASQDNIKCGNSSIWPLSANASVKFSYIQTTTPVPTFVMNSYTLTSETPPPGVTSGYYVRVSGNVDRSGYPYGFAGFGANLMDVNNDGSKKTVDFTIAGYSELKFWYKNGPSVTASTPWKVKLPTSVLIGAGPCKMEDVDNQPVKGFTTSNSWQKFDAVFATNFAPESGWGQTTCGNRGPMTTCVPGSVSYYGTTGAQYKCTAAQALTAMNALQWQTNFAGSDVSATNPFDLEIAQVEIIKQ
jgi:hypothetical protein